MKHINIPIDEADFEALDEVKGERSWREAILEEFGVDDD